LGNPNMGGLQRKYGGLQRKYGGLQRKYGGLQRKYESPTRIWGSPTKMRKVYCKVIYNSKNKAENSRIGNP